MQKIQATLKIIIYLEDNLEEEEIGEYIRNCVYDGFYEQDNKNNELLDVLEIEKI